MSPGGAVSPQSKRAAKGVTFYTVAPGRESRGISGTGTRRARRPCGGASNMPRRGSRRWFVPPRNQSMAVIAGRFSIFGPMPTPTERNAILFLGALACMGGGVRALRSHEIPPPTAAEHRALEAQIAAVDSTRHARPAPRKPARGARDSARKQTKATAITPPTAAGIAPRAAAGINPPAAIGIAPRRTMTQAHPAPTPAHRLDLDAATAAEIQALPGIGPTLAARIVADRDSNGPFGSLEQLCRVKGMGPATTGHIDSLVSFSGAPRGASHAPAALSGCGVAGRKQKSVRPP